VNKRIRAYLFLLLVAIIWGLAGPVIKFTLQALPPIIFLAYRFAISSLISLIFFTVKIAKGKRFRKLRKNFRLSLLYSFMAIPFALGALFLGLEKSTVLDLSIIGAVGPLMTTMGGWIFFHEHITRKERVGILIVLAGVFINSFLPIILDSQDLRLSGNLLLLAYLFADSSSILIAKRVIRKGVKSENLTNLAFIVGAIFFIPLALITYGTSFLTKILSLSFEYHLGVWYMSLLSGTLAYFLYVRGAKTIEVSEAVLFTYLQPIFSIPLAIFWLNETPTIFFFLGAILILLGVFIAESKNFLARKSKR